MSFFNFALLVFILAISIIISIMSVFKDKKKHFYSKSEFIFTMSENMLSMLSCLLMVAHLRVVCTWGPLLLACAPFIISQDMQGRMM